MALEKNAILFQVIQLIKNGFLIMDIYLSIVGLNSTLN